MSEVKRFQYFDVYPGEITTVRFSVPELAGDILLRDLRAELIEFISKDPPLKLLLDFTGVNYFSSMLVNCLLRVNKIVTKDNPGQMKLGGVHGDVKESFTMLRLDQGVISIFDSVDDATAAFDA